MRSPKPWPGSSILSAPAKLSGCRPTVGPQSSKLLMRVRFSPVAPACWRSPTDKGPRLRTGRFTGSNPVASTIERLSFNGRTVDCQSADTGSNPVSRSMSQATTADRMAKVCACKARVRGFESHAVVHLLGVSSNGRTSVSQAENEGSTPSTSTKLMREPVKAGDGVS